MKLLSRHCASVHDSHLSKCLLVTPTEDEISNFFVRSFHLTIIARSTLLDIVMLIYQIRVYCFLPQPTHFTFADPTQVC